tara:strand:+ start:384 stop:692 length:309 start_codon:yes stop_codon:yes gene_type:complete
VDLFKALEWYVGVHFKAEEKRMKVKNYPAFDEHKNEHEDLASRVSIYHKELNEGKNILNVELLSFFNKWLQNHIAISDKKYSSYLNRIFSLKSIKKEFTQNN